MRHSVLSHEFCDTPCTEVREGGSQNMLFIQRPKYNIGPRNCLQCKGELISPCLLCREKGRGKGKEKGEGNG